MSTLEKIQKVMRVLAVIVRVIMVCAFVGGGLLLIAGIVCLCVDNFTMAAELQRLLVDLDAYSEYTNVQIGLALLADAVLLLANGVMLVFAVRYFHTELKDGTPFTLAGANAVRHMGIVRIVATIVAAFISSLLTSFVDGNLLYSMETANGIFFGVALILASLIFRHGAELQQAQSNPQDTPVSLQKTDFVLQAGKTYTVGKDGALPAGAYQILATDENHKTFNLRVNDFVKAYNHNTTLVLADGDKISARSGNVILR